MVYPTNTHLRLNITINMFNDLIIHITKYPVWQISSSNESIITKPIQKIGLVMVVYILILIDKFRLFEIN